MKNSFKTKIGILIFLLLLLVNFNLVRAEDDAITENIDSQVTPEQILPEETQTEILEETIIDEILVIPTNKDTFEIIVGTPIDNPDELLTSNTDTIILPVLSENEDLVFEIDSEPDTEASTTDSSIATTTESVASTTQASKDEQVETSTKATTINVSEDEIVESSSGSNTSPVSQVSATLDSKEHNFSTNITRDENFIKPAILAEWQMLDLLDDKNINETDDSLLEGAQILPSGQFGVDKKFSLCALVADSRAMKNQVSATISYPKDVAHSAEENERGCGNQARELTMLAMDDDLVNLVICDELRLSNNNLITWNKNELEKYTYNYSQVCGNDGFLAENKATLYCATTTLAFDDPAGNYLVEIASINTQNETATSSSYLKYLELTVLENDFSDIQYGMVTQNEIKYLPGDLDWENTEYPSVRNAGNTRLKIIIWQNDFNLGKTEDQWNVMYKSRIGKESEYIDYYPEQTTALNDSLSLGELINIDLAILILDYPENEDQVSFSGEMTLTTTKEPGFLCEE